LAKKVTESVLDDLREAGYFSLSVDSTADLSHVDKLIVTVRYVSPDDGFLIERFLTFLELSYHSGENLANIVLKIYVAIAKWIFVRAEASHMIMPLTWQSGIMACRQISIKISTLYNYIPCAGHSLNLVGRAAVDWCLDAVYVLLL
jgi:hypothetical protein